LNTSHIEDLASKAIEQIGHVIDKVKNYKTAVQGHDEYIHSGVFNGHHVSSHPFYIWKNEQHKDLISKLLSGQPIVVKADITASAPDKDAVKFNLIEINLKSANATRQQELNNTLKGFKVKATHLGNSYYRYDDQFYVISNPSQVIKYSFEKSATGVPMHSNHVYNKIKSGGLMLSPYAMWKFQLINLTNRITFKQLTMYKDEVDLELVGTGSYVTKGVHIPDLHIEHYYRSEDPMLFLDNEIYEQYELLEQ